jgi:hypothetical protein
MVGSLASDTNSPQTTSSPHWRGWLKPENRCLVPVNSFAEYAPEPNPETKKKDVVWFALNDVDALIDQLCGITLTHLGGMAARCSRDMVVRRNIDAVVLQIRREIAEACSKAADECDEPPLDEQGPR